MFKKIIIKFTKKNNKEITNFNTLDFEYMMHLLYKKGQILKHRIIDSNKSNITVTITAIDEQNFFEEFKNVSKILDNKYDINFEIGNQISNTTLECTCKNSSFYIINPEYDFLSDSLNTSLLKCGDCGHQVPWINKVLLTENEAVKVTQFQDLYEALETLRLKTIYEDYAEKEITMASSKYNKYGLKIRNLFEKKLLKPVYFLIKNPVDGVKKEEREDLCNCPICNSKLSQIYSKIEKDKFIYKINKKCEYCKIVVPSYE